MQPSALLRAATLWIVALAAALACAMFAAGQMDVWLGERLALLLLAAFVGGAFLLVFSFVGPAALVVWPIAATGGYLVGVPRDQPVITFDRVWVGGLLAYLAVTARRTPRTSTTRFLAITLGWLAASYGIRTIATSTALNGPIKSWVDAIVIPLILYFACERYALQGQRYARRLALSLMLGGGVLGAIGLAERLLGFELATFSGGNVRFDANVDATRISGPYPAPEPYALTLVICLGASFYWILSRRRGTGYGWTLVPIALQLTGIGLALFRAGWIAAALVIVASLAYRPGTVGRAFGVILVSAAVALAATTQVHENKTVSERLHNTDTISARLATYNQGVEIFESAPMFGIGVNEYHTRAEQLRPEEVNGLVSVTYPHSSYIGVLAEQGIFGFLPLVLLTYAVWRLIAALRRASFASREAMALLGPLTGTALGFFVMSLTLTMLPYGPPNAFFAVFLAIAAARLDASTLGREPRGASL
jgi:O-antigen ligase